MLQEEPANPTDYFLSLEKSIRNADLLRKQRGDELRFDQYNPERLQAYRQADREYYRVFFLLEKGKEARKAGRPGPWSKDEPWVERNEKNSDSEYDSD